MIRIYLLKMKEKISRKTEISNIKMMLIPDASFATGIKFRKGYFK